MPCLLPGEGSFLASGESFMFHEEADVGIVHQETMRASSLLLAFALPKKYRGTLNCGYIKCHTYRMGS